MYKKYLTAGLALIIMLLLLSGCNAQPNIPPELESIAQKIGEISSTLETSNDRDTEDPDTSKTLLTSQDTQQGFTVREPKDDRERFAMEFAEKLFYAAYMSLSSLPADFEVLADYVDVDSFSPLAPLKPTKASLGHLIVGTCFANVTEKGVIEYGSTGSIWTADKDSKSIGIIDADNITRGTLTVVALDANDGNIIAMLVDVRPAPGGYAASPLSLPTPANPSPLDKAIVFSAPHGCIVEYQGGVIEPVVVDTYGLKDYYELQNAYRGKDEAISVFCGSAIGSIDGTVFADTGTYGGSSRGYSGYDYTSLSIRFDVAALAVTRKEFRPLRDVITERTQAIVTQIGELLDAYDLDGFVEMAHGYGAFLSSNGRVASSYRGYFDLWRNKDSVHGADREISINAIEVRGVNSLRVKFTTMLTIKSGNTYTADSRITLDYVNGDWLILEMSNEIFKTDTNTWTLVE